MKKILALVLVTLMLLSCNALAVKQNYIADNMQHEISEAKNFNQVDSVSGYSGADTASQRTDVWLQVEASGQIDVTVPLVAIFKTNIDGGKNIIDKAYRLVNNSSANIAVTKVEVVDQMTDVTTNGNTSNMTMVSKLTGGTTYDEYTLRILPEDRYATPEWTEALNVAKDFVNEGNGVYSVESNAVETKGLWLVEKKDATVGSGDDESYISMALETSKLSFVTKQQNNDEADIENGIMLFTVTYTVKIDDSEAKGGDITGNMDTKTYADREDGTGTTVNYTYKNTDLSVTPANP